MIIESCVENLDEAVHAVNNGAHQVEICRDLAHDGLTPDENELIKIISTIKIPCKVMIRSRAGDFFYTHKEIQDMIREIQRLKSYRIDGFVFGALSHGDIGNITLDMASVYQICKAAYPIPVTIHKAIDLCTDILKEVEKLKKRSGILGALLVASVIIGADLGTQLYHTQRALEIAEQRIEVLEVQAHDIGKEANNWRRSYFNSYKEYWERGSVQIWDDVKSGKLTFETQKNETEKGEN